jgi:hypothetical protein
MAYKLLHEGTGYCDLYEPTCAGHGFSQPVKVIDEVVPMLN